ncbi:hypothetical protein VOLCADRAFT_103513 [Volvox carteri f. nagariensis]|uniref:Uncharacterized protein n=1 Tax=Volvox carteri f. nagariensis TaxID=3068 RepID=D8TMD2_VOLCA|nr:uncharacterized protein VOLCADRAFT_103513 [Volvox carteri f. nagariensis]EFJ51481.1 hypothetical protein VOLCADRAFT_103513 [Volvox carteri f. nagariensis]|eukprot:XP_002947433.1 hypothetical protein VOLCADRAFT_103513 [Volvox carteri f. nagariensis]
MNLGACMEVFGAEKSQASAMEVLEKPPCTVLYPQFCVQALCGFDGSSCGVKYASFAAFAPAVLDTDAVTWVSVLQPVVLTIDQMHIGWRLRRQLINPRKMMMIGPYLISFPALRALSKRMPHVNISSQDLNYKDKQNQRATLK